MQPNLIQWHFASVVLYLEHDQLNTVYCTTHTTDKHRKRRCSHFLQGSWRKSSLRGATNCTDSNQDMVSFHRQSIDDELPKDDEAGINKQYTESIHTVSTVIQPLKRMVNTTSFLNLLLCLVDFELVCRAELFSREYRKLRDSHSPFT